MRRVLSSAALMVVLLASWSGVSQESAREKRFTAKVTYKTKHSPKVKGKVYFAGKLARAQVHWMEATGDNYEPCSGELARPDENGILRIACAGTFKNDNRKHKQDVEFQLGESCSLLLVPSGQLGDRVSEILRCTDIAALCSYADHISCARDGYETINKRSCEKWILRSLLDGSTYTAWVDRELRVIVRYQSSSEKMVLKKIREGVPRNVTFGGNKPSS